MIKQGCHEPEKHGKLGNLKNCHNLREDSGKFQFLKKNLENSGKLRSMIDKSPTKMFSIEFFSLESLREKFENALKISGKTQGI